MDKKTSTPSTHSICVLVRDMLNMYDGGSSTLDIADAKNVTEGFVRQKLRNHLRYLQRPIPDDIRYVRPSITQISKNHPSIL